jgi:hypothetical protein
MLDCTCIIAQILEAQGNKNYFSAIMLASYAGLRGPSSQASTTFRTTKLAAGQLGLWLVLAWVRGDRPLGTSGWLPGSP